jgi:hypothetical protein
MHLPKLVLRDINRQSLPAEALAEVVRVDAEYARAETERPFHSLKDGEVREVVRVDRAGHEITEFYTKDNSPSFWMDQFKPPVIKKAEEDEKLREHAASGSAD